MAEEHEVWLLTRPTAAKGIERQLVLSPLPTLHPVYVDLPDRVGRWVSERRHLRLHYVLWQQSAWSVGRALHRDLEFDIGHHVTLAADWMPAGLAWIKGLPLVWGPVGGSVGTPWALWRWLGARGLVEEAVREVATRSMRRIFGVAVAKRASLIAAQNREVAMRFRRFGSIVVEPNVALATLATSEDLPDTSTEGAMRKAVFVGRLQPHKGLRLAVAVLARPEADGWILDVYGEGEEARPALRLARRLGVEDRVRLLGQRPRSDVLSALRRADALLYPSLHDQAPWAVGEALSVGCPVVCLDRGGPSVLVGETQGARVSVQDVSDVVSGLAKALSSIDRRIAPSAEWSRDRLSPLLKHWYSIVITSHDRRDIK